jgi:bifunctional non-homologous end joining protein LigD
MARRASRRPLSEYARKRDFARTAEPPARRPAAAGRSYCIQQHAASRLHWDFRLELDGVLLSWAVPKGPSLDPADKRLAVQVEDHPVAYGSFEGVIPEGQYGGGTVLLWDKGRWEPQGDPRAALRKGQLKFRLDGRKLRGGWVLVRLHGRAGDEERRNWLLIKERDEEARPDEDVVALRRQSVKSAARDIAEVARKHRATPRQLASARKAAGVRSEPAARGSPAPRPGPAPRRAPGMKAPRRAKTARPPRTTARAGRDPLPAFVPPELCTLVGAPPEGEDWVHEVKLDGYRLLARLAAGKVRLWSRNRVDWTARLPSVAQALAALPARSALLDGELVLADLRGRTSFEGLKAALGEHREDSLTYVIFDLLHLDGHDLRGQPLLERKRRLEELLRDSQQGPLRYGTHVAGRGAEAFGRACRLGLEGVVSKRADAPYESRRGGAWLKSKCTQRQEFVIVGYTQPSRREFELGSLVLGVHEDGRLRYAGRVGTGFDARQRGELRRRLDKLATPRPPFEIPREPELRDAVWARPKLVGEVAFTEWTSDGRLRHPSFQGLREDKPAKEVVVEKPKTSREHRKPTPRAARSVALSRGDTAPMAVAGVRLTHPDKLLWPEDGVSKQELARYYEAVAPAMLPHLRDRPLTLVRCPEGSGRGCFFQKHAGPSAPAQIGVISMPEKNGKAPYMTVRSAAALVALAQIGALELHIGGVRADAPLQPDRMVLDLDPAPDVPFARVMEAARELRRRLSRDGLRSFVMTTGGKGLHVVVPLARHASIEEVAAYAAGLARGLERDDPAHFVSKASKAARSGRIFVDWIRNARGATAICPFSTRARPGAPVAVPLAWSELKAGLKPDGFSLEQARARATRRTDPWKGHDTARGRLPAPPASRVTPRAAARRRPAPSRG